MASRGDHPRLPAEKGESTDAESAGSYHRKGKKKKKKKSRESSPASSASDPSGKLADLLKESQRQAAKAAKALKELQAATAEVERAQRGPVPKPLPAVEPMQVDQPAAPTSTQESRVDAKKGSSEGGRAASEDSSKATPTKPVKAGKVKALTSSLPPPSAIEPAHVEQGAVEDLVPDVTNAAIAKEAWETVTKRVRSRRQKVDDRPAPSCLNDFRVGKIVKLPSLVNGEGESDDEEWFEDKVHPIDWYVNIINGIVSASSNSGVALEERTRLKFAWDTFMPGGRCIFTSCQRPRETPRRFSSDGRYARHLVEYHRAVRPVFGCNDRKGQLLCRSASNVTGPYRTLRRGLFVRHINDGNANHKLSVENALKVVHGLIVADKPRKQPEAGVATEVLPDVTKGASQKYFMSWEGNVGEGVNPTRLHIMSEMFAAFHGMNPWYRSHYRRQQLAQAANREGGAAKRAHSTDTTRGNQKKAKAASSQKGSSKDDSKRSSSTAPVGKDRDSRSRETKPTTSTPSTVVSAPLADTRPAGPTCSAVVKETATGWGSNLQQHLFGYARWLHHRHARVGAGLTPRHTALYRWLTCQI